MLWGVLHVGLGVGMLVDVDTPFAGPDAERAAESAMFFVCAVVFGAQAVAVGLLLNSRNADAGYWINLLSLGAVDAAFLVVMVLPGHVDLAGGLAGPVIWSMAAVASTWGRHQARAHRPGGRELRPEPAGG